MNYDIKQSGNRIHQLRIQAGYTQSELALRLNIDRSFLSHIESGKKGCSVDLLVQISNLFSVSLDYLALGKDALSMEEKIEELISHLIAFKEDLDMRLTGPECDQRSTYKRANTHYNRI